jgi:hypothetical protein
MVVGGLCADNELMDIQGSGTGILRLIGIKRREVESKINQ